MSKPEWLSDGKHILVLMQSGTYIALVAIDIETGSRKLLVGVRGDIKDYSADRDADTIAFSVQPPERKSDVLVSAATIASGLRIPFHIDASTLLTTDQVFITRRKGTNGWTTPERIAVPSLDRRTQLEDFIAPDLSLSPNGTLLLLKYYWAGGALPDEWKKSRFVQEAIRTNDTEFTFMVLHNVRNGEDSMPLKSAYQENIPLWADDSKSYVLVAQSPIASNWERQDASTQSEHMHLFWVQPSSSRIEKVADRVANELEQPLYWGPGGELLVRTQVDVVSRFDPRNDEWVRTSETRIPFSKPPRNGIYPTSDGVHIVAAFMNTTTPPELILYQKGWPEVKILQKLNPQFDDLAIAPVETVHWQTSTGYEITGLLLKPPNYVEGVRYPLVIQTKEDTGSFLCDSGEEHFPSFAPQPMADSGIMYLIRTIPATWSGNEETSNYPKGYPGGIGRAAFYMDMWDRAVDALDKRGLVDRGRVGIIGFSLAGWYTEFALAHSQIRYAAATAADNIMYSMGTYWYLHDRAVMDEYDALYGGPPYGATFKNWLQYSVSFNLDKFHTPLLMEEMGYGKQYDAYDPPANLATSYEMFSGLSRLDKPVELYYYPNEQHLLDHPKARLATLQRNLDWYRFWLQGYERPYPDDPDQYVRWRHLRALRDADVTASEHSK